MRTPEEIAKDVDRLLDLDGIITNLIEEGDAIGKRLKQDSLDRPDEHEPLSDEDREGKRWFAVGTDHRIPIILTADKLVQSFTKDSKIHTKIRATIDDRDLVHFFTEKTTYQAVIKDGKAFRKTAREILGENADRFVAACRQVDKDGIPKSDVKIDLEHAEPIREMNYGPGGAE